MQGNTAAHYAASNGKKDIVMYLVDHGANVSMRNKQGRTPFEEAKLANQIECVALLPLPDNQTCRIC